MAFQPTQETQGIPGNERDLQTILSESKEQMLSLTWCVLSYCIYRDKNRHKKKVGEKNKEWQ